MVPSTDLVTTMKSVVRYLYQFACPILMLMGTIGNILNLILFTQRKLRKNPCSIYFIAYNVVNLLQIYAGLLPLTLSIYLVLVSYYTILKEIVALSLMIICGLWALKNIRSIRRVEPTSTSSISRTGVERHLRSASSKDRQLISMLRLDITIYGLFSFVFAIFLIYQQITQDYLKSPERIEIEVVIGNLCLFIIGIPFCTSCYTNLIVSKTFRKKVKKVLSWKRLFCME